MTTIEDRGAGDGIPPILLQETYEFDIEAAATYLATNVKARFIRKRRTLLEKGDRFRREDGLESWILLQPSGHLGTTVTEPEERVVLISAPNARHVR
jgi:hypothetical protein